MTMLRSYFLALHSVITPSGAQRTLWDAGMGLGWLYSRLMCCGIIWVSESQVWVQYTTLISLSLPHRPACIILSCLAILQCPHRVPSTCSSPQGSPLARSSLAGWDFGGSRKEAYFLYVSKRWMLTAASSLFIP